MRVPLPINIYTQINTNATDFLIQNLSSSHSMVIIVAVTQPAATDSHDFVLEPYSGIASDKVNGLIWGKPMGKVPLSVGLVQG